MSEDWVGQTFNDRYEILELLGSDLHVLRQEGVVLGRIDAMAGEDRQPVRHDPVDEHVQAQVVEHPRVGVA